MSIFRRITLSAALCVLASSPVFAQIAPEISFCPAGVQADGFIDWSKLPTPPIGKPVTATIPVTGIAGLTATIQFQAGTSSTGGPGGSYSIVNPADLSLPLLVNPTITFNRPVQGVSVNFQSSGRFGRDFTMTAYSSTGEITSVAPVPAQVQDSAFDYPGALFSTSPLQIRSTSSNLIAVGLKGPSDTAEYFSYDLINLRVESGSAPDPSAIVPKNGLKEWLRADRVSIAPGPINIGNLLRWPDQSGKGSDAVPPTSALAPYWLPDGPNCTPVASFAKFQLSRLDFDLPINGWTEMTVFIAGQAYADAGGWYQNQALSWNETAPWGMTFFTPSQTNVFFRFGTTQPGNQPIYPRPATIGGDFSVTTAIHNGATDSLYVNGILALEQGGKYPVLSGVGSTATIGAGIGNTPFTGNIGEILIYNRALGVNERAIVERYLESKYGVR